MQTELVNRSAVEIRTVGKRGLSRALSLAAATVLLTLGVPSVANAAYEQVPESFGTPLELYQTKSIAINHTGAGGVEAGSFYVVGGGFPRVSRYSPGKEGEEPQLEEQWGWGIAVGGGDSEYVRCGPAYATTANPAEHTYKECTPRNVESARGGPEPGHFSEPRNVAVDQATGNVYVLNSGDYDRKQNLVEVLTANGEPVGEGFGDLGVQTSSPPESISEGPERIHGTEGGLTVDESGVVYLLDQDFQGVENRTARVMSFKPCSAGNYESYCYASGADIAVALKGINKLALIGSQRLVATSQTSIEEYPLGVQNPTPVCSQPVSGQLYGLATNELTGEVFWFRVGDHRIHRLGTCDEATGHWQELESVEPQPKAFGINALAVNPTLVWGPGRPAGVLYAVENSAAPSGQKGYIFAPALAAVPPTVESESIADATTTSATLTALIDPQGSDVTYHFEYLSAADYAANGEQFEGVGLPVTPQSAPVSPGHFPAGAPATVTASISGLSPDTAYVFRVVASSECNGAGQPACVTAGEPMGFATYPPSGLGLPDDRGYELVSPATKSGGEVFAADASVYSCLTECKPPGTASGAPAFPMQSAPNGNSVAYMGYPFSSTEGAAVYNSYVSGRTAGRWQTAAMSPPLLSTKHGSTLAYSDDLSEDVIEQSTPQLSPQAPAGYNNLYLQAASDPANLTPLLTTAPPSRSSASWILEYKGYSPDFQAQFFAANDALTQATPYAPEAPPLSFTERDLYQWQGGQLSLVNVLPGNTAVATGATFASASPDAHAVSADGRRVFWSAGGHLYVREDGQMTQELQHPGVFLSASEDGSEVLFEDGCLYSLATEECTDLTQGEGGFLGIAGASLDLSRIYFVDKASLSPEAEAGICHGAEANNPQGQKEEKEGKVPPGLGCNLYLYEAGGGTRFIATLGIKDGSGGTGLLSDWGQQSEQHTAEASPDGHYLAIASQYRLTGYDNLGLCGLAINSKDEFEPVPAFCSEVFLYDSASGDLQCASCNPTGEAPRGISTLRRIRGANAWIPQPRYLTNQGRLFFDSQDRLSPRDVNGKVEDVYEFEPEGAGSCGRAAGCVTLISPGTGSVDSNFLAMSETGSDVFFTSRERLVPTDTDDLLDLYDAREAGGFPQETETQRSECQGESCQPAPTLPTELTPASLAFNGAGNLGGRAAKARGCPKGKHKVKRNGKVRCVPRHKKGHRKQRANADRRAHR